MATTLLTGSQFDQIRGIFNDVIFTFGDGNLITLLHHTDTIDYRTGRELEATATQFDIAEAVEVTEGTNSDYNDFLAGEFGQINATDRIFMIAVDYLETLTLYNDGVLAFAEGGWTATIANEAYDLIGASLQAQWGATGHVFAYLVFRKQKEPVNE